MSLAAPTRPLPSSPNSRSSDLPSRSNSIANPSRKGDKHRNNSTRSSPLRGGADGDSTSEIGRSDREREKAARRLSGQLTGDPGPSNASTSGASARAGFSVNVNDVPQETVTWGSNFWVTIQDPMTSAVFYACPSTGQTSWEPPAETFLMPITDDGHWWELADESRGGTPYYYHTKTGETQWTRPDGFVIPLGIIQTTTSLGRRLSQNTFGRSAQFRNSVAASDMSESRRASLNRRSRSHGDHEGRIPEEDQVDLGETDHQRPMSGLMRRASNEYVTFPPVTKSALLSRINPTPLTAIPASPDVSTCASSPTSLRRRQGTVSSETTSENVNESGGGNSTPSPRRPTGLGALGRSVTSPAAVTAAQATQSLAGAAEEIIANSKEDKKRSKGKGKAKERSASPSLSTSPSQGVAFPSVSSPVARALKDAAGIPPSPKRTLPAVPPGQEPIPPPKEKQSRRQRRDTEKSTASGVNVKDIGHPIPDPEAAKMMAPLKTRVGKPILVDDEDQLPSARLSTGDHKILPRPLAADIEQFAVADFAKRYFSTHKTGLIFKRRVPVEQMMSWQKGPLQGPLLVLNRSLHKDAVKCFKVIQKVMGDRDREKPVAVKDAGSSSTALAAPGKEAFGIGSVLEEERWMLTEGLAHGELRDEIYCQVVKQLSNNPSPESAFHGWQLLCVLLITFPPSKNFEAYLRSFMQERLTHTESRIDIMAKYCLSRLVTISKKGPRPKPPTIQEIESAADAAFNPSTFGESLESIMRLQLRTYPESKVPIILPFLADSIIALGGSKREGIFRIPGDGEAVMEMKVRIDKGHYNLQGIDDPHVPASLLKMWLRELQDPVIPVEMYNECIQAAENSDEVIKLVKSLPTINRRVLLFVISFLQLFLPETVTSVTKMGSPSLALVLAPNLIRCESDSVAVVLANSKFEHMFVHNLLLHLKCHKIDPDYIPTHGIGGGGAAGTSSGRPKSSHRRGAT
ncbi:hypothetical protein FRB90_008966 [Tulasnella sp. 427]|nr:hypothetical protein FRB90_008966 [Tulasnella sp. 427]